MENLITTQDWRIIFQLVLAGILGAAIGLEREYREKPAGHRTYLLVSLGVALFTIFSREAYDQFIGVTNYDPSRIAAQVLVGIGFIGAGSILHRKDKIEGLTTAAGLWTAAAIGMAVGNRFYAVAIITTIFVLITLITTRKIYLRLAERRKNKKENIL